MTVADLVVSTDLVIGKMRRIFYNISSQWIYCLGVMQLNFAEHPQHIFCRAPRADAFTCEFGPFETRCAFNQSERGQPCRIWKGAAAESGTRAPNRDQVREEAELQPADD